MSIEVNPSSLDTLAAQAADFQMYRFTRVSANIISDASTSTSGMLVAAFVRDAADHIPSGPEGIAVLDAQPGMKQFKIWQASTRINTNPTKWLYTSPSSDIRLSSQLQLVIMAIGNFTQEVTLNVILDYTVELRDRTLQPASESIAVPQIRPGYTLGVVTDKKGLWAHGPGESTNDAQVYLEFEFPTLPTNNTNVTFRYLAPTSLSFTNSEIVNDVTHVESKNMRMVHLRGNNAWSPKWQCFCSELNNDIDDHKMDHTIDWLTEYDNLIPVMNSENLTEVTNLANSLASLGLSGKRSKGYVPTWEHVMSNSSLLRAYSKVGLMISKENSMKSTVL